MDSLQLPDLGLDMRTLGKSLIVLGSAFLASGIVFMISRPRKVPMLDENAAQNIDPIDHSVDQ